MVALHHHPCFMTLSSASSIWRMISLDSTPASPDSVIISTRSSLRRLLLLPFTHIIRTTLRHRRLKMMNDKSFEVSFWYLMPKGEKFGLWVAMDLGGVHEKQSLHKHVYFFSA